MDLVATYKNILSGVQHGLSQVGNTIGHAVAPVEQAIGNEIHAVPQQLSSLGQGLSQGLGQATHQIAQQPILQLPGFTPPGAGPTLGQAVNTLLPNFKQSTVGTLLQGKFSQVPQAFNQDFARANKAYDLKTPEGLNTFLGGIAGPAESDISQAVKNFGSKINNTADRNLIGAVAELADQRGSAINKVNLDKLGQGLYDGNLGQDYHRLAVHVFGQDAANWPTTTIKNAFDLVMGKLNGGGKAGIGLAVNDLRQGEEASAVKAPARISLPESTPQAGGSTGGNGTGVSSPPSIPPVKNPTDPFYNVNRLNISNDAKQHLATVIDQVKPQVESVVGKPLSHNEVIAVAQKTSSVLDQTVTREQTTQKIAANLKLRQKIADVAQTGKADKELIDAFLKDKAAGADIARQLEARKIGADPAKTTVINTMLDSIYKVNQNADEIAAAAKGVDFNDAQQATAFYRQFVKPKLGDWVDKLRYNSMLSSPNTHINNTASNFQGTGIVAPIEKTVLGGVDFLKSTLTGSERQYFAGEGPAYAKGFYGSVGDAAHRFADVMKGTALNTNPDTHDIPLTTGGAPRLVERALDLPTRLLEGMDQFFGAMTQGGERAGLDYRASKGVNVGNIDQAAGLASDRRLFRADLHPKGQGTLLNAIDDVTGVIQRLRGSSNKVTSTVAKFSFPFVKTPMNILKQGIEYSPAGFATVPGSGAKTEQVTKALMGSSIALAAATLLGSDRLTWAEPTDQKKKAAFRAAGIQPYAVKIGDTWVSYSKLHPIVAFNLALVAAVKNQMDNAKLSDSQGETILTGFSKWLNFFADQSYMKQMGDLVSSAKGDLEGPAKYLSNYPTQLIPYRALLGWVTRIVDPVQRRADPSGSVLQQQFQSIMTQIPGLSTNVPPRLDTQGNPILNQHPFINAVSPARVTTELPDQRARYDELVAKTKQTQLENATRDKVAQSGGIEQAGDTVFYKQDGQVKSVQLNRQVSPPNLTGQPQLDKIAISKYNSAITAKISDIQKLVELGKLDPKAAETQIEDLQQRRPVTKVTATAAKPKSTKVRSIRKPKLISLKIPKVKKIRAKGPTKVKIKQYNLTKVKLKT